VFDVALNKRHYALTHARMVWATQSEGNDGRVGSCGCAAPCPFCQLGLQPVIRRRSSMEVRAKG
jgi:hypothetical protein